MYPAFHKIKAAKQLCYLSDVNVTETFAEIKLQSLMHHATMRLCKMQEDVLKSARDLRTLDIIVKWGCDGAEQSRYKQKFSSENCSYQSLFNISILPIHLMDLLPLGLSPLHTWIRFFECILHLSYRLEIKSWQARGAENKNKVTEKKKQVQEKIKNPFIANLRSRPETIRGKISNEARELLEIRARVPFEKDAILSESSDIEESKSDLEESDLDSE
ncbi:hypothetical protein AVEN_180940-1 [Araneus ventricosus]|uniref:Uncharacterized protein n=1 Tax=Araneus ventricosus TaxID=182803 RepID=A0A4Y2FIW0_ARAVE|nr:hypothetical protein AVEN_180940-1 [Araneus ventricosus]